MNVTNVLRQQEMELSQKIHNGEMSIDDLVQEHIMPCELSGRPQRVVWIGTILEDNQIEDFENWFKNDLGFHVEYETSFKLQGGFYKGYECILFSIANGDIPMFTTFRIHHMDEFKWYEDFYDHFKPHIPQKIKRNYPKRW